MLGAEDSAYLKKIADTLEVIAISLENIDFSLDEARSILGDIVESKTES